MANKICTYGKYLEDFQDDYEGAFNLVVDEIYTLLTEVGTGNYEAVAECKLNRAFRYKLLELYYPDEFVHVHTDGMVNEYLDRLGLQYNPKDEMIYRNLILKEWKDSVPILCDWNNSVFMPFCVWLIKNNIKLDGTTYVVNKTNNSKKAQKIEEEISAVVKEGAEKAAIVKVRVNQGDFRDILLKKYSKCVLCGVSNPNLLIASHIKPWSVSEAYEKLDINNGFLMCPNHDRLFDQGWITFSNEGQVVISPQLLSPDRLYMNVAPNQKIALSEGNMSFLEYHRKHIFKE